MLSAMLPFLGILGANEIILILIVVLLLFGGRKIPELMRGLGQGIKEFKKASRDSEIGKEVEDLKKDINSVTDDLKKNV